MKQFIVTYHLV